MYLLGTYRRFPARILTNSQKVTSQSYLKIKNRWGMVYKNLPVTPNVHQSVKILLHSNHKQRISEVIFTFTAFYFSFRVLFRRPTLLNFCVMGIFLMVWFVNTHQSLE